MTAGPVAACGIRSVYGVASVGVAAGHVEMAGRFTPSGADRTVRIQYDSFSCSDRCFRYGRPVTVDPSACNFYDDGNRVCVGQCDFASVTERIVRETIEQVIGTVLKDGRAAADGWRQS